MLGTSPLMSIVTHLYQHPEQCPASLHFIYSARKSPSEHLSSILFFDRLCEIFTHNITPGWSFELYLTRPPPSKSSSPESLDDSEILQKVDVALAHPHNIWSRRFVEGDLLHAIGAPAERERTVVYVCGPPAMTDWTVDTLRRAEGMPSERVMCEKWW